MGAQESANKRQEEVLDVDDEVPHSAAAYKLWSHIHPALRNKRISCTIFIRKLENGDGSLKYFENGIKLLKQLKHPNILKFVEGACAANDVSLVTERVQMLDLSFKTMSFVEIQSGLRHILEAITFLHNKASLSHNNISPSSVFVCDNGEWKLGGFEFTSPPAISYEFTQSKFCDDARMGEFLSPEHQKPATVPQGSSFVNDSYGFGKLIEYVLQDFDGKDEVVRSLKDVAAQLTVSDPAARLPLSALLDHPSLSNDLTEIITFCNTIQLREEEERNAFFGSIVARLRGLPEGVVARRLCRLLLSRYVLLEPKSHSELYPGLLVPTEDGEGVLSRNYYCAYMVPELVRLFRVRETAVRIALLSQFDRFARHVHRDCLQGFITDEVVQGCHDSDSHLVSASLRALATLVDILGAENVCPWHTTKKFGNGSPQRVRPSKSVLHINNSRTDRMNYNENTKSSDTRKSVLVDSPNNESEWLEEDKTDWNSDFSWSADWKDGDKSASVEDLDPDLPSEVKETSKQRKPATFPVANSKKDSAFDPRKANIIGSEFEINVVPKKCIEDDLFADLTPNIPSSTSLLEKLKDLQTTAHSVSPVSNISSKFAMLETSEDAGGWDDSEDISPINTTNSASTRTALNAFSNEDDE